jgi:hypothetical protein
MAKHLAVAGRKNTRSKTSRSAIARFEIVHETSSPWSVLYRNLSSLGEAAAQALGEIYAAAAQSVLERKEGLEDRLAEQKARRRIAARAARSADPTVKRRSVAHRAAADPTSRA